MASSAESGRAPLRASPLPSGDVLPDGPAHVPPHSGRVRWLGVLVGLVALHLTHPLTWGDRLPGLWFPAAGVGFALLIWFGPRAAYLILLDGLLAAAQVALWRLWNGGFEWSETARNGGEAVVGTAELLVAWWAYRRLSHGVRDLSDPRSAILFLVVGPGLTAGLFALGRAALLSWSAPAFEWLVLVLTQFWLSRALGLLAVAPALLTTATPWLVRRGFIRPEIVAEPPIAHQGHVGGEPMTRGDWLELAGLALGAGVLGLLLSATPSTQAVAAWQPWGAPLLLIVWASLRQGLRGGAVTAGVAAALPLLVLDRQPTSAFATLIQANLLAQCGAGLLAAAAAGWVRLNERRYRQVLAHVPVVVYSGSIRSPKGEGKQTAEVTLVSAACGVLLGCTPEELLGPFVRWLEHVHPQDREVVLAALAQLGRQRQPVTCEYRLARYPAAGDGGEIDDGKPAHKAPSSLSPSRFHPTAPPPQRWVRDVLAPRFDADGRLAGWEGVVTDVTEQRALAVDLRHTTNLFNALVRNLPAGVFFIQGPIGQPILVNARARQLLGQREDTAAGLEQLAKVYRLFRHDGTPYPVEELPVYEALRHGRSSMRDDIVVHRPDGRRIPLVTWAAPVKLGGPGVPDAAVWVLEDLTALHQAEAARRDSESRLRTVIETMAEGLIVVDRTGVVLDCNPAACGMFQRPLEEVRGRPPWGLGWTYLREDGSVFPDDDQPATAVLRSGRPVRNLVLGLRSASAASEVRWFLVNAMPLSGGPLPAGVVTTYSDMTAYRHAQDVLRTSEEKHRGLVESLPLMVVQSDRNLRLLYVNPEVRAVTGYDLEDIADPSAWAQFIHAEDLPRVQALAADALQGRAGRMEVRYRAKDGTEKTAFTVTQPNRQGNAVVGIITLLLDVTRERQLEQELQRAQRLELIGRLSSGIAHDFNNLLTIVLSMADIAHDNLPPGHPVHDDLYRISEAGEQAARLAGQLLAFGKQRRTTAPRAEVNGVARRTLHLLRGSLPKTIVVKELLAAGELFVPIDETQTQQILMNLCLNGRDAMPDGGSLTVRTETGLRPADNGAVTPFSEWVCLSVSDEGGGMSEALQARIFDPFFSTKERGTGLGLAVVRQIADGCGGRVEVRSQVGEGACFTVWLPSVPREGALPALAKKNGAEFTPDL